MWGVGERGKGKAMQIPNRTSLSCISHMEKSRWEVDLNLGEARCDAPCKTDNGTNFNSKGSVGESKGHGPGEPGEEG